MRSFSAAVSGSGMIKATWRPSGDQAGWLILEGVSTIRCASPASTSIVKSWCLLFSIRSLENTNRLPSGDHRGSLSDLGPLVNGRARPTLRSTNQIRHCNGSSNNLNPAPSTNAARSPDGAIWTSEMTLSSSTCSIPKTCSDELAVICSRSFEQIDAIFRSCARRIVDSKLPALPQARACVVTLLVHCIKLEIKIWPSRCFQQTLLSLVRDPLQHGQAGVFRGLTTPHLLNHKQAGAVKQVCLAAAGGATRANLVVHIQTGTNDGRITNASR